MRRNAPLLILLALWLSAVVGVRAYKHLTRPRAGPITRVAREPWVTAGIYLDSAGRLVDHGSEPSTCTYERYDACGEWGSSEPVPFEGVRNVRCVSAK